MTKPPIEFRDSKRGNEISTEATCNGTSAIVCAQIEAHEPLAKAFNRLHRKAHHRIMRMLAGTGAAVALVALAGCAAAPTELEIRYPDGRVAKYRSEKNIVVDYRQDAEGEALKVSAQSSPVVAAKGQASADVINASSDATSAFLTGAVQGIAAYAAARPAPVAPAQVPAEEVTE